MDAPRFPTLPWAEPCATLGIAAVGRGSEGGKSLWLSAESLAKRQRANDWVKRINEDLAKLAEGAPLKIKKNIDDLQADFADSQWLGLICSDGNGLGQVFMDLDRHLKTLEQRDQKPRDALGVMKAFSEELEQATQRAFYAACLHIACLGAVKADGTIPVIPLLLGGDDMATLVDGQYALPFAQRFLTAFEEETASERCPNIRQIAEVALGAPHLSAGSGVALIKHHFPFHLAHELADSLLRSSKEAKKQVRIVLAEGKAKAPYPVSALDFHVLFDASFTDLDAIRRERLTLKSGDGEFRLFGGPYVVTPPHCLKDDRVEGLDWAEAHRFQHLTRRFDLLSAEDEDGRARLPSSQMHALREAVAQGKATADARLRELGWLNERGLCQLAETGGSLFFPTDADGQCYATRFVDAINGAGFWPIGANSTGAVPAEENGHE